MSSNITATAPADLAAALGRAPIAHYQGRAATSVPIGSGYLGGTVSVNLVADHDELRRTVTIRVQRWVSDPANPRRAQVIDREGTQTRLLVEDLAHDPTQDELDASLRRGFRVLLANVDNPLVQAVLRPADDQDVFQRGVAVHDAARH